jgi:hypothetical protein
MIWLMSSVFTPKEPNWQLFVSVALAALVIGYWLFWVVDKYWPEDRND